MNLTRIAQTSANTVLTPAKLALKLAGGLINRGGGEEAPAPQPADPTPDPQRDRAPKPLDDVALARKVESVIFRDRKAAKGKIDVNAAEGVVWLRGEAKTPDLIKELERRTKAVPEVERVENLLHLPKTPAPTRTDTPARQRKTTRTRKSPGQRKVQAGKVTNEQPAPAGSEPTPKEVASEGKGRPSAPLGD